MLKKLNIACVAGLLSVAVAVQADPVITVDSPSANDVVTGIIQVYGWASGSAPVDNVTLQLDNNPPAQIGYGGERNDVTSLRPDDDDPAHSGFSTALNTRLVSNGLHTVTLTVNNVAGDSASATMNLTVYNPTGGTPSADSVDLSTASVMVDGQHLMLNGVLINGQAMSGVKLMFNSTTNGFHIIGMGEDHAGHNHGADNDNSGGMTDMDSSAAIARGKDAYVQFGCAQSSCHGPDPAQNNRNVLAGSDHVFFMQTLDRVPAMAGVKAALGNDHATMQDISDYLASFK